MSNINNLGQSSQLGDVVVPAVPLFSGLSEMTADGLENFANGGVTHSATPSLVFFANVGDTYSLYDNGVLIGTMTAVKQTTGWTLPALANGLHNLSLTDTNAAGTSAPLQLSFTVAAPPAAPQLAGLSEMTADGIENFAIGGVTHSATPSIVFYANVGDTYTLYDNNVLIGTMTAVRGITGWTLPVQDNGVHHYTLTDTNGNGTSAPLNFSFTVATVAPAAPVITSVIDATGPLAGNVASGGLSTDGQPAINGTGHAGDIINVYDNTTLLGSTLVRPDNTWSFQPAAALANGAHNLHTTATNFNGTSPASSDYPLSVTNILITAVYDANNHLVANGGEANGALTITGWISNPDVASAGMQLDVMGGNLGAWQRILNLHPTVDGNTFTVTLSKDMYTGNGEAPYLLDGTFSFGVEAFGSQGHIMTMLDPRMVYTVTDDFQASAVQSVAATHVAIGEHDALNGAIGHATVDLNADPASYFAQASAHIQGGASGVNTLHLTGAHQVLDLNAISGKTASAKLSGVESIDLGGHANTLKLSLTDVLNLGEQDLFQKDGKQQMMVNGSNGDAVDLSSAHIAGVADGQWAQHGTAQVSGVTYNVYEHSGVHAELLVQQGVQIALHN